MPLTRRELLCTAVAASLPSLPAFAAARSPDTLRLANRFAAIETGLGGRLGVAALDTGSGRGLRYRGSERFPMCSTHKFLTVAAILQQTDQGRLSLAERVPYGRADLLAYAPIAKQHIEAGFMSVEALCAAAIEWSDNTAANLLLRLLGGPAGWTRYARSLGDEVSRLDRIEPMMNAADPGDPRDTTTPEAMLGDLHAVLLGGALRPASRRRLEAWLTGSRITRTLLRADLPPGWRVGDKSGSGDHGTRNDIGFLQPPHAASPTKILAAVYITGASAPLAARERAIAEIGRIIAETLTA